MPSKIVESRLAASNRPPVERIPVDGLLPAEGSPIRHSDEETRRAQPFVARYADQVLPVVVSSTNRVLIGQLFVEAAKRQKITHLWVIRQDAIGEKEEQLYSIAGTRLLQTGQWDADALDAAVRAFEEELGDFSPAILGFPAGELDRLIGLSSADGDADALPKMGGTAVSKVGTVWTLGRHRLSCGDATDVDSIRLLMDGKVADAAPIDPPFGGAVNGHYAKAGLHREFVEGSGDKTDAEMAEFFERALRALSGALRPGAVVHLFIDWRGLPMLLGAGQAVFGKLLNLCVWAKTRCGMGGFYRSQHELVLVFHKPGAAYTNNIKLGKHGRNRSNVWTFPAAASLRRGRDGDMLKEHPTPKTVDMIVEALLDCTNRGDLVLDTFSGTGTTLMAAERSGRICHAMDLDPLYVDLAVRRWQRWTGKNAVDAATGQTFDDTALALSAREVDHV